MPTYSYACKKCGHEFDVFHRITESPKLKCASCGSSRVERLLGTGAGIIFKGSGFYETDFKNKKGKAAPEAAASGDGKKPEPSAAKSESKTESKPAHREHAKTPAKKQ